MTFPDGPAPALAPAAEMNAIATAAVERLRQRLSVGELRESAPGWNAAFVGAIRSLKEQFRGSPDLKPLLSIASEQLYGRDIHWALELIQNAEDAGARRIVFVFEPERVLVHNDGEPFSAADVWGICSAGHSTKKNKIGFFGIGFKSVFKLSDVPEVRSGPYAFKLEEKIYPTPLEATRSRSGARFLLPVIASEQSRLPSIVEQLTSPEFLHLLLTLESLQSIVVVDRIAGRGRGRFYRREVSRNASRGWDECEIGGSWPGSDPQTWRRYRYATAPIPTGIVRQGREVASGDRSSLILARPANGAIGPTKLHCFLPMDVASELRWLVQADFDPTPGRERLRENDWNRWLMAEIGRAAAAAVESEARSGEPPWPLIPLPTEVTTGSLQRRAFDALMDQLRVRRFVRARAGWRTPASVASATNNAFLDVVREADLPTVTGTDVSYLSGSALAKDDGTTRIRMRAILSSLGYQHVGIPELARLLELDDSQFGRRDGRWWLQALDLVATEATADQRAQIATTACIPIAGGRRVAPSPRIDLAGYLVAYTRSATLEGLRRYFGESEIHLVDPYLDPTPGVLAARRRTGDQGDMRVRVRDMLRQTPFGVAVEAGPFHVVTDLVIPRMAALAGVEELNADQQAQLARMIEFVRTRWRGYISDFRRVRRTQDEGVIARQLGSSIRVVARVGHGRAQRVVARPLTETYLSSKLIGQSVMDVALAGKPDVAVIDDIHVQVAATPRRLRSSRAARALMDPATFLRLLGGLVGPRVRLRDGVFPIVRTRAPWVSWPPDAAGRQTGIDGDSVSEDIEWLVSQWPQLSGKQQERRGRALWDAIDLDWDRVGLLSTATAAYFYYDWRNTSPPVAASWIGTLQAIPWVGAADRTLRSPRDLVRNSAAARLAMADDDASVLGWQVQHSEMIERLGVSDRPAPGRLISTLQRLREGDLVLTGEQSRRVAAACYELLANEIAVKPEPARTEMVRSLIRPKFQGNGRVGLVFAPPPAGLKGKSWWPPSRVVRADVSATAGPYVAQLAGRYPRSAALWDALGVRADLDPDLIKDIVAEELVDSGDDQMSRHFYGELVVRLDALVRDRDDVAPGGPPALTDEGWRDAPEVWWTSRQELRGALRENVPFWSPGTYDPSIVRGAARWLGVRELTGEVISERWTVVGGDAPPVGMRARWLAAVTAWPELLRSQGGWDRVALGALGDQIAGLEPSTALAIDGRVGLQRDEGALVEVQTRPRVLLRDRALIALTVPDLFGHEAADALGQLAGNHQLAASSALAALLGDAFRSPEAFAQRIAAYSAGSAYIQASGFADEDSDPDSPAEVEAALEAIRKATPPVKALTSSTEPPRHAAEPRVFADPSSFELLAIHEEDSVGQAPPTPPAPRKGKSTRKNARPEETKSDRIPGDAPAIPPNTAIEDAARPYIEMFEMKRGGFVIHRQGPLVGADYVADDGRYIELKATGGAADDAFVLERSEWEAALHPTIGKDYWVYIVEHLNDGGTPEVTAVFNPVRDAGLRHDPVGKMKVSGWHTAAKRERATFGRRQYDE